MYNLKKSQSLKQHACAVLFVCALLTGAGTGRMGNLLPILLLDANSAWATSCPSYEQIEHHVANKRRVLTLLDATPQL